jgi:prepilin-type processing-associated H-X9-DG protein
MDGTCNVEISPTSSTAYNWIHYGYNIYHLGAVSESDYVKSLRLQRPSETIVTGDVWSSKYGADKRGYFMMKTGAENVGNLELADNHSGGSNIVWADGHVSHTVNAVGRYHADSTNYYFLVKKP